MNTNKHLKRIAFIGAGGYARTHMTRLQKIKDVKIVGVSSRTLATAQSAVQDFGGKAFDNAEDMLDEIKPDAVFICVIPGAHGHPERLVIERNIPFLVEKPIALNMQIAREIEKEVSARNLITAVGYQWRYLDIVQKAKALIGDSPILLVQGYWLSRKPNLAWWNDPALSGGQIVEQATHMIDLARFFLGEAKEVNAVMSPPARGSNVPAASALTIRFQNRIPATIICACELPIRYRCGFIIHTEEKILELFSTRSGMMNVVLNVKTSDNEETFAPVYDPVLRQDEIFLKAIDLNNPALIQSDYADAVKSLRISLAANESNALEKSVTI